MNTNKLIELLLLGENQSIEFKRRCRPDVVGHQVCAFLNSGGGYIVCGVDEKGSVVGVDSKDDISSLERELNQGISPKTLVSVEVQEIDGRKFIIVEVPSGKDVPYAFRNVVSVREGAKTIRADIETIRDMVLRRQVEPERWERRFSTAEMDDVDVDEIHSTVRSTAKTSRIQFHDSESPKAVLEDLSVSRYGRLTNGGDVLFGRNPAIRFPQVRVRAVCFTTDKTDNAYRDMKSFEGPLVSMLEQVYAFIERNTSTASRFRENELVRQDEPLYPTAAVREGLVNAFSHRDYSDFSGGVAIHIYPNRLEIWNSGSFPEGVTPDTLTTGHISVLRNPDIAHVLYLRGLMEKLGRGSVMIQKTCEERGLPKPKWHSEEDLGVTLTFFAPEVTPEVTPEVAPEVAPEVMRVLEVMEGSMSRKELQEKLGLRDDEHFRTAYLQPALAEHYIEMTIPDKPRSSKQKYRITRFGQSARKR